MEENKPASQKVDMFLMANGKYFESYRLSHIRSRLHEMDEEQFFRVQTQSYKDPVMILVVSLLVGYLGIDRILIGEVGLGIAKLLTCGGLGIWTIVDWFLIMGATRDKNLEHFEIASAGY